jgi:hypothetical protein
MLHEIVLRRFAGTRLVDHHVWRTAPLFLALTLLD